MDKKTVDNIAKTVYSRIDQIRQDQGLSYRDLAFKAELDKSTIVKICTAQRNIGLKTLIIIANALDVEVGELFK